MTIKTFIEEAVKAGYDVSDYMHAGSLAYAIQENALDPYKMLLDPLAWQAVGKVEGWHGGEDVMVKSWQVQVNGIPKWRYAMHRFIDALCDGKTLEEALDKATS